MPASDIMMTLIGGPTVLIEAAGIRLLTDPTFDPPGQYPEAVVPLEKTMGPSLSPDQVGKIDAVLLSHDQHLDNLDHSGRKILPAAGGTYTTLAGAARLGGNAIGLAPFETRVLNAEHGRQLYVTGAPARHGPVGIEPISGDVVGFLIGAEQPGDAIYVTGDTVWFDGTAEVARRYNPRLVILFTGSAETRGRFHLTMDSNDALEAAHAFPDAYIVAIHNEGWKHFKESGAELAAAFATLGVGSRLTTLEQGRRTRFEGVFPAAPRHV